VEAAIQRKVEGQEVSFAEAPSAEGVSNVVDLMEVLKASLNARGGKAEAKERKAPKKAPAPGQAAIAKKSRR
jgi:non-homologous end joining protein Ku